MDFPDKGKVHSLSLPKTRHQNTLVWEKSKQVFTENAVFAENWKQHSFKNKRHYNKIKHNQIVIS